MNHSFLLLYNRDPTLPLHKLTKIVKPFKGDHVMAKRIEQSHIALSTAAKMLQMMREAQKGTSQRPSECKVQVGDMPL